MIFLLVFQQTTLSLRDWGEEGKERKRWDEGGTSVGEGGKGEGGS